MKLGILGTGMIVKDVLTMYHELGVEKTYLFSTEKSKSQALELMEKYPDVCEYLSTIISEEVIVQSIDDMHRAFENDLNNDFKTVMKWEI